MAFSARSVRLIIGLVLAGGLLALVSACRSKESGPEVRVFAAASLQNALAGVLQEYRRLHPDQHVVENYAGSNTLARQIENTRKADLFFSADERWMNYLAEKKLLDAGTRVALLSNTLVVVGRTDTPVRLERAADLLHADFDRLILADPELVPAGRYAKQYLSSIRSERGTLWDKLAPKVMPALDVRAALGAVLADPRRIGIVYATDLRTSAGARALLRIPASVGPRIRYPVALVTATPNREPALQLLAYLRSPAAARSFEQFGFTRLGP